MADSCAACGDPVTDALARVVRLSVDRSNVDEQRLCPACFADWIDRYETEMAAGTTASVEGDEDIIVD
ncbi:DUF7569 family protein [Candidatus Halobonum tyrrellensis]|uniref:Small CPxCG-related zinc finger protein n=1 Tax=Candidatus Halobonum tyrrellensis G22 TaxID=1324957 RepID=V4GWK4_9EURY|nr:hypothetical protein [Candidatus Halobonum tyrrellensis]ESP89546.1 hypothetical protein K933_03280 [Candidatus Halobonum tyrrellensis G22]